GCHSLSLSPLLRPDFSLPWPTCQLNRDKRNKYNALFTLYALAELPIFPKPQHPWFPLLVPPSKKWDTRLRQSDVLHSRKGFYLASKTSLIFVIAQSSSTFVITSGGAKRMVFSCVSLHNTPASFNSSHRERTG